MFLLASCGGGGGSNNPAPVEPTTSTTSTTPTTSNPARGTVLRSGCSADYPGVKWFVYADGDGGEYKGRDTESVECGYVPPPPVTDLNTTGDRFVPVVFDTGYEEEPEIVATLGRVTFDNGQIRILGDGEVGEGTITINGDEWQYTIQEEPRCGKKEGTTSYDCQSYRYAGTTPGYIYYGEDDDRVVEWELAMIYSTGVSREYNGPFNEEVIPLENTSLWQTAQRRVDQYNEAYERSGVHIRYVLKEGNLLRADVVTLNGAQYAAELVKADVLIVLGVSGCPGACGCASPRKSFTANARRTPLAAVSQCGVYTDLHEIGHTVGLAHGPENRGNPASGYIWREFGHGWESINCGYYADIMSYSATRITHHNSKLSCREVFGENRTSIEPMNLDLPTGDRDYADSAYHLNRVRYDVSLIYSDYADPDVEPREEFSEPEGDVVIDRVESFENGLEMLEQARREHSTILRMSPSMSFKEK
jgi:hypothetical protein